MTKLSDRDITHIFSAATAVLGERAYAQLSVTRPLALNLGDRLTRMDSAGTPRVEVAGIAVARLVGVQRLVLLREMAER